MGYIGVFEHMQYLCVIVDESNRAFRHHLFDLTKRLHVVSCIALSYEEPPRELSWEVIHLAEHQEWKEEGKEIQNSADLIRFPFDSFVC